MQTGICTKVETKDFFSNKNLKLKGPEILFSFGEGLMTRKGSF